jgi:predicted phage-related endonuclease
MSENEIAASAREYRSLKNRIKELEQKADAVKQELIHEMDARQTDTLVAEDHTIHYDIYESSRLDTTALKKELPDIAARFMRSTTTTQFRVA